MTQYKINYICNWFNLPKLALLLQGLIRMDQNGKVNNNWELRDNGKVRAPGNFFQNFPKLKSIIDEER